MKSKNTDKLPKEFYLKGKVEVIAPKLLGKLLKTRIDGELCSGKIVEVEAYCGLRDKACHAYFGKTNRNSAMFEEGGVAYVYLCYGIHRLFNIIVGDLDHPSGILIRAVEPVEGLDAMKKRRGHPKKLFDISNGPGKLSQALGIQLSHNGESLQGNNIWLEENEISTKGKILAGPRIGIDYAGEDKHLPWRFALDSPFAGHRSSLRPR